MHSPRRPILFAFVSIALLWPQVVSATWYNELVDDGADIMMMDLRWPWWSSGTYFANWNSSFNPKPNNVTFYAGFTSYVPEGPGHLPNPDAQTQDAFSPSHVWTFWGGDAEGKPVRFLDSSPRLYIMNQYGGEGSSGTVASVPWRFIHHKRWYTMLARVWQPIGGGDHAYVGRWIKDHTDGRWHMIAVARLPIAATSFAGNSGFIEPLSEGPAVRSLHRRLGYFRKDGRWQKSNTVEIGLATSVIVNTIKEDDHEYLAIEYAQRPDLLPLKLTGEPLPRGAQRFTVRQPDSPKLDKHAAQEVAAKSNGRQVAVSWEVPVAASPAFAYKIEVFDNVACEGSPLTTVEQRAPTTRHVLIDAKASSPTVRLTLTDIFDQQAKPIVVTADKVKVPESVPVVADTTVGLAFKLYHKNDKQQINHFEDARFRPNESHFWLVLAELANGELVGQGLTRGFDRSVRGDRRGGYAIEFEGLLRVPTDGMYMLHTQIDGAYRIAIDGRDVIVRDGQLGSKRHAEFISLGKGDHTLTVTYLYDQHKSDNFAVEWEGPGFSRQLIPLEALRVRGAGLLPKATITGVSKGDGSGHIKVDVDPNNHAIKKIVLFNDQMQVAESAGKTLDYAGPMLEGKNAFWARVFYDANHSMDTHRYVVNVVAKPVPEKWTARNVSNSDARVGLWNTGPEQFEFVGEGMHTVTQKIRGDFTATCRIDFYSGKNGEPVYHRAWVGLSAREYGERLDWRWGQNFNLIQTARDGLCTSPDNSDLGAGRISSYTLPAQRPWLRIVRAGQVYTAWTSTDGKAWELGAYHYLKTQPDMDVGLFFNAPVHGDRARFRAKVSQFTIEPGVASDTPMPTPPIATGTGGDRVTGVVVAPSNPDVVVIRSTSVGLMRTTDGGVHWSAANGTLAGDDLAVRSVAIHPKNPLVILRAGGRGKVGRLWKTIDGGLNWKRLDLAGDFDGVGPSAVCGEIIAFDERSPEIIYVGCESAGLFKSVDGGAIWKSLGLKGERVTSVKVWPWERYYPNVAADKTHIAVTTCPDHWMAFLGRGKPSVSTASKASRCYISYDDVKTLVVADHRTDTGFYNVVWDKATQNVLGMVYGSTHGIQTCVSPNSHTAVYHHAKNVEAYRPFTALGAAARGDKKLGRVIAQALDPVDPNRLSRSELWALAWHWLSIKGDLPKGGLIAVHPDRDEGNLWWFVFSDGVYRSLDAGQTLLKVLGQDGVYRPLP